MTGGTPTYKAVPQEPALNVEPPQWTLNAADRCDTRGCGARAYWRIVNKVTLHDLVWCKHHGEHIITTIEQDQYIIFDERDQLNVKLDASA